jgi:hypothetical protein
MTRPTATELVDEVLMTRSNWSGTILLVEGDKDVCLFERLLGAGSWRVLPSGGWETLIDALKLLEARGEQCTAGIADRDHRSVVGRLVTRQNLFYTDLHDTEIMMIESSAFSSILREHGSQGKIRALNLGSDHIKRHVYAQARPIACLRFHSEQLGLGYCFRELDFSKFISKRRAEISIDQFVAHMSGKWSRNYLLTTAILSLGIAATDKVKEFENPSLLCCGHDVTAIVAIGLKGLWGTHNSKEFTQDDVERALRLAYPRDEFEGTELSKALTRWVKAL